MIPRNVVAMRKRIAYLHQQAMEFRSLTKSAHSQTMRDELLDLAERCDAIATRIEQNLPIHRQYG